MKTVKKDVASVPVYSAKLNRDASRCFFRVRLGRVPPACIKIEPTNEEFILRVVDWKKPMLLRTTYPKGVSVRVTGAEEAEFDDGILTISFKVANADEKQKKSTTIKSSAEDSQRRSKASSDSTEGNDQEPAGKNGTKHKKSGKFAEKRKKNTGKSKKDDRQVSVSGGKYLEDSSTAMEIADGVAEKVEEKSRIALEKAKDKERWEERNQQKREEKRAKRAEKLEAARNVARKKIEEKESKRSTSNHRGKKPADSLQPKSEKKRKVTFSSPPQDKRKKTKKVKS